MLPLEKLQIKSNIFFYCFLIIPHINYFILQIVFENTLMQHHVALPPGSMGKISYIAPPGQYSLKVDL